MTRWTLVSCLETGGLPGGTSAGAPAPGANLANRLRKNLRRLEDWAREEEVQCYRVYDADLPQYPVSIDLYEGRWAHVLEHESPDSDVAGRRLSTVAAVAPGALGIAPENLYVKERAQRDVRTREPRRHGPGERHEVLEGGARFLVNFTDFLDTGLFLDHRATRRMIRRWAAGRSFLNLFCYTASATVHAAAGGAVSTVSVDTSNTYLDWARDNMALNGFEGERHRFALQDARDFLETRGDRFDLIFMDPPTFSNSRNGRASFSVQRDHVDLLRGAAERLAPGGMIVFSNNYRRFELDGERLRSFRIEDITAETIPRDFQRDPLIHRCWLIRRTAGSQGSRAAAGADRPARRRGWR